MEPKEIFDLFVTALESNKMDLLERVLDSDVEVRSSALGNVRGIEQAKELFAWKGEKLDFAKIRIFNNVLRRRENFAAQSVFFVILLGKEINSFMNHFQCAFLNAIEYRRRDGEWRISRISSNMTFECGNSLLVVNHWNLIDYRLFNGNDLHLLDARKNSPWVLVPDAEDMDDEQKIKQCFWRYNWLIDTDGFDDLPDILTDNLYVPSEGQNCKGDFVEWLREKRKKKIFCRGEEMPKEACWNHISAFKELKIDGDRAKADIYRFEPNRIGTRFLHKYNLETVYYSHTWHMEFAKDSDGEWKMDRFGITAGIEEDPNEMNRRYF